MNSLKYNLIQKILNRGPLRQAEPNELDKPVFVSESVVTEFEDNHSQYGYDSVSVRIAWENGKAMLLVEQEWQPAEGYSAEGIQQDLMSLTRFLENYGDNSAMEGLIISFFGKGNKPDG